MKKNLLGCATALVILLTGCAHVNETYLPDGRKGHIIQCSHTQSMGDCYKAAADVCKEQGYQIIYQRNDVLGNSSYSGGNAGYNSSSQIYGNSNGVLGAKSASGKANWWSGTSVVTERDLLIVCGASKDKNGNTIDSSKEFAKGLPQNTNNAREKTLNQKYEDYKSGRQ